MANLCIPLSAGEDTFDSVQLQLEAMEKQIHELLERQAGWECGEPLWNPPGCPSDHGPWVQQGRKTQARPWARTSPPPVFEISTQNRFAPLCETEHDAVIVRDFIVWSVSPIILHTGVNDIKLQQTETLKRDFRNLIETIRSTSPVTRIIVSGPLPTYRRGHERFSFSVLMACTPAESERNSCRTTSPGCYTPFD
ncbi:putative short US2 glycoprotein [Labeo rohita]|uniref:Short US2 glycoprotein n=1 Tax=Labeo rohita TaxID=84645 RepID=A0ABQ8MAF9_LABRO|nr:putative short US2 glycoprotein [Labeo rohita]